MEIRLNMARSIEDVGHHATRDLGRRLFVRQGLENDEGEQHGRARGLARNNVAVRNDWNARAGTVEIERTRRVARNMLALLDRKSVV